MIRKASLHRPSGQGVRRPGRLAAIAACVGLLVISGHTVSASTTPQDTTTADTATAASGEPIVVGSTFSWDAERRLQTRREATAGAMQ